jgi:GT2 family glycosyltransferase
MLRECREADYLQGVQPDAASLLLLWESLYQRVLRCYRQGGNWLFLHYDQVLHGQGLEVLGRRVEAVVDRSFPQTDLSRSTQFAEPQVAEPLEPLEPRLQSLYELYCGLAGYAEPLIPGSIQVPESHTESCSQTLEQSWQSLGPSGSQDPDFSISLCSRGRPRRLLRCLEHLQRQQGAVSFEVLLVVDAPEEELQEALRRLQPTIPVHLLTRTDGSLASARNAGLERARGRFVLFINDDTLAQPDLLQQHLRGHTSHSDEVCVLGSFDRLPELRTRALARAIEVLGCEFPYAGMQAGQTYDWNRFWTANVSLSRQRVLEVGGFDESYAGYGCEDTDLGLRLTQRGVAVLYHPDAKALHDHPMDLTALRARQLQVARAYTHFFVKNPTAFAHPDWAWVATLHREQVRGALSQSKSQRAALYEAAARLATVDIAALESSFGAQDPLTNNLVRDLAACLRPLNRSWWLQGFEAAWKENNMDGFRPQDRRFHLETTARQRVLAWPRYDDGEEITRLFRDFAPLLTDSEDVCLCLRHDANVDGGIEDAVQLIRWAYERYLGSALSINVLLVTDPIEAGDWPRLGAEVTWALDLIDVEESARTRVLRELGVPLYKAPEQLRAALATKANAPVKTAPVEGSISEPAILSEAESSQF